MKPTPEQVGAAEAVVEAWQLAEHEILRDGHRHTLVGLIARALAEGVQAFEASNAMEESLSEAFERATAQARREGALWMRQRLAEHAGNLGSELASTFAAFPVEPVSFIGGYIRQRVAAEFFEAGRETTVISADHQHLAALSFIGGYIRGLTFEARQNKDVVPDLLRLLDVLAEGLARVRSVVDPQ